MRLQLNGISLSFEGLQTPKTKGLKATCQFSPPFGIINGYTTSRTKLLRHPIQLNTVPLSLSPKEECINLEIPTKAKAK